MNESHDFTRRAFYQRLWTRFMLWVDGSRTWLVQGLVISIVLFALIIAVSVIFRVYGYGAPVELTATDPDYLGILCPGDRLPVHNQVHVNAGVVAYFYISTTDVEGLANYAGTQWDYPGFSFIKEASFVQTLPWEVPDLPHGSYLRVTSARGSDGREKPSQVWSSYIIADKGDCTP